MKKNAAAGRSISLAIDASIARAASAVPRLFLVVGPHYASLLRVFGLLTGQQSHASLIVRKVILLGCVARFHYHLGKDVTRLLMSLALRSLREFVSTIVTVPLISCDSKTFEIVMHPAVVRARKVLHCFANADALIFVLPLSEEILEARDKLTEWRVMFKDIVHFKASHFISCSNVIHLFHEVAFESGNICVLCLYGPIKEIDGAIRGRCCKRVS